MTKQELDIKVCSRCGRISMYLTDERWSAWCHGKVEDIRQNHTVAAQYVLCPTCRPQNSENAD